jgi:hypothetical protein
MRKWCLTLATSATSGKNTARESTDAQHETEVIPQTRIGESVDSQVIWEKTNDKGNRCNKAMPQSEPKARDITAWRCVGLRSGAGDHKHHQYGNTYEPVDIFSHDVSFSEESNPVARVKSKSSLLPPCYQNLKLEIAWGRKRIWSALLLSVKGLEFWYAEPNDVYQIAELD